jgi:pyruvate dehydrogenase E2 component (dihydrolipoamide acetyltransferase)
MAQRIDMPSLGQTTDELVIVEWLKREGDAVALGESLFSVQTDKAQVEVESIAAGTLLKVLRDVGETVRGGSPVAFIGEPGETLPDVHDGVDNAAVARVAPPTRTPVVATETPAPRAPVTLPGRVAALPAARRLANELGVDLSAITGTGQDAVITVRDVEQAAREQRGAL